jgi:hypothetical protein
MRFHLLPGGGGGAVLFIGGGTGCEFFLGWFEKLVFPTDYYCYYWLY